MRIAALLLCLLPLAVLSGCSNSQTTGKINDDLTEAANYAALGQTAQAKFWCSQAIAVDPNAVSTYVTMSDNSDTQPDVTITDVFYSVDDATLRDYIQQAVNRFPNAWQPLQVLVETESALGDTADQHGDAAKLAALLEKKIVAPGQTHDEQLMLALAQAYCDAGNLAKGTADYQNIIRAFPKDSTPYNNLAYAWAVADSKPNLPQALADAQKAVTLAQAPNSSLSQDQIDMNVAESQDTLGWVQHQMGDDKDAVATLEEVISSEPRIAESHYHLGVVYLALGQPEAARAELDHAVQLEPGLAEAQAALAALPKPAPSSNIAADSTP